MKNPIIFVCILIALAATAGMLVFGLFSLYKGGEFNRKYGNKAMQWRVLLQAIALILFTLLLILGR
ncbi:MAG: twin transmembrane helix small protein [Alphaproteobacteria bacterium]|nr:twin transmembrane helix small protein [Alphaproteobacteria bacterium]